MKLSSFRIKDKISQKPKLEQLNHHQKQDQFQENNQNFLRDQKFAFFFQSFQNLITTLIQNQSKSEIKNQSKKTYSRQKRTQNIDYRDRYVIIELPETQSRKINLQELQEWIGQVCKQTLSVAFHYFTQKKMNYEQMKIFASESILRNLSILVDNFDINAQEIEFIDKIMKKSVFPYLKAKYPLTVENSVNKALQNALQQIDNTEILANDYFFSSQICFEYRQSERYDDLIMRLVNEILRKIDMKIGEEDFKDITLYKDFQNTMSGIFQKSYDEFWMNSKDKMKQSKTFLSQKQKQRYKQKVEQYTQFLIGRKVSENIQLYTEQEIKSGYLSVKSPAILRLLTKWCEELWEKFQNQNYFRDRTDGLGLISHKKIGLVFPWLKKLLSQQIKIQKGKIEIFLKQIQKHNYIQQNELLKNQLQNNVTSYIEKCEKVVGIFACKVFNNIQHFIVIYLNRLIHGLLNVSKQCYKQMKRFPQYWPSPYNLLSFKIGDLIRCKYSSKQREVLKIFQEIQKLSKQNEEKFKIIRIKNRLRKGTKDILINAIFNNTIKCQIQLAINSTTSDFIVCANYINHYIYELQRSRFGPLSQICSIWKNLETRSKQFDKIIFQEKPKRRQKVLNQSVCLKQNKKHSIISEKNPFICSQCSRHTYQNNFIVNHSRCKYCDYFQCAACLIKQNIASQNKEFFLKNHQFKDTCKFWKENNQVPKSGICVYLKRTKIEPIIFKTVEYNFKNYLIRKLNDEIVIMKQVSYHKDLSQFLKETVIFQIQHSDTHKELGTNDINFNQNLIVKLFIPQQIKNCLKQQKQTISILRQDHLTKVNFNTIISQYRQKLKSIKNIQFSSTYLNDLNIISPEFINLRRLNINLNRVKDVSKITQFKKLQKLYMNENQIQKFPEDIDKLSQLKQLDAYSNKITTIPENIVKIKSLIILNLNLNQIKQIPQNFYEIENLKHLYLKKNKISNFPKSLTRHKKLQTINLEQNLIQNLPEEFEDFSSLTELYISSNKIGNLPKKMQKCRKLKVLMASNNSIEEIPQRISDLVNLQILNLSNNKIPSIPGEIQFLVNLRKLHLSFNEIKQLNQLVFKLEKLNYLDLKENKLVTLPDCFEKLKELSYLYFNNNQIKNFPLSVLKLSLQQFFYDKNPYEDFPFELLVRSQESIYFGGSPFQKIKKIVCPNIPAYKSEITYFRLQSLSLEEFPQFALKFQNLETIHLKMNKITVIPEIFQFGMKIKEINLTDNKLKSLPKSMSKLNHLTKLTLYGNELSQIPDQFSQLSSLQYLNIQKNQFKKVPECLQKIQSLKGIFMSSNEIEQLPQFMGKMTNLQELIAGRNKIKDVPLCIWTNKIIRRLNLSDNLIEIIPKEINQMTSLARSSLFLSGNPLVKVEDRQFLLNFGDYGTCQQIKLLQEEPKSQNS